MNSSSSDLTCRGNYRVTEVRVRSRGKTDTLTPKSHLNNGKNSTSLNTLYTFLLYQCQYLYLCECQYVHLQYLYLLFHSGPC